MKPIIVIILSLYPYLVSSQSTFSLKTEVSNVVIEKGTLHVLDNRSILATARYKGTKSGKLMIFEGIVQQPSNFAKLTLFDNTGKSFSVKIIIDEGNNVIKLASNPSNKDAELIATETNESTAISNKVWAAVVKAFDMKSNQGVDSMLSSRLAIIKQYPNKYYSLLEINKISQEYIDSLSIRQLLEVYESLSNEIKASPLGLQFKKEKLFFFEARLNASASIPVQNFRVKDSHGHIFDNAKLKGKYYVIAFSAVWCGPCQKHIPDLKKIYSKYHPLGLEFIYFNDDDDHIRWLQHIKKNQFTWINVSEGLKSGKGKIQHQFGIKALPNYLIIDKKGFIVYNSNDDDDYVTNLDSKLREIFEPSSRQK